MRLMAKRGTKPIDPLTLFAAHGLNTGTALRDSAAPAAFAAILSEQIARAIQQPTLLRGLRAEAMFEAFVVSLGQCAMLEAEDQGTMHAGASFKAPDFRLVLKDGSHWLVEVKHVWIEAPSDQRRTLMEPKYFAAMSNYAKATGADLKLAIFWARWGFWTLVDPKTFVDARSAVTLDMLAALSASEMARLGDRWVGTTAPLILRLTLDPSKSARIYEDGRVERVISSAGRLCGDAVLSDERDKSLAWFFMQFGQCESAGPRARLVGDRPTAIDFVSKPVEATGEGFDMVGPLSRMFSHYYAEQTSQDGEVTQLFAPPRPEWLQPLIEIDRHDGPLPLWTFAVQPPGSLATTAA